LIPTFYYDILSTKTGHAQQVSTVDQQDTCYEVSNTRRVLHLKAVYNTTAATEQWK